jgi:hypothetical protein
MQWFLALLLVAIPGYAVESEPVTVTDVKIQLDLTESSELKGTGLLILRHEITSEKTSATTSTTTDIRCEVPVKILVQDGKAALRKGLGSVATETLAPSDPKQSFHVASGFIKVKDNEVETLTEEKLDNLSGKYELNRSPEVAKASEPTVVATLVNDKGVGFILPVSKKIEAPVTLLVISSRKAKQLNGLCQQIQKQGFVIKK